MRGQHIRVVRPATAPRGPINSSRRLSTTPDQPISQKIRLIGKTPCSTFVFVKVERFSRRTKAGTPLVDRSSMCGGLRLRASRSLQRVLVCLLPPGSNLRRPLACCRCRCCHCYLYRLCLCSVSKCRLCVFNRGLFSLTILDGKEVKKKYDTYVQHRKPCRDRRTLPEQAYIERDRWNHRTSFFVGSLAYIAVLSLLNRYQTILYRMPWKGHFRRLHCSPCHLLWGPIGLY